MQQASFWERGGAWVIAQNALTAMVVFASPFSSAWSDPNTWRWVGSAIILISALYGVSGVIALGKNRTVFPHPRAESEFVEVGIYRIVRHPLYASVGFFALGWSLFWRSVIGLTLSAALMFVLIGKARREEAWLCQKFAEYSAYKKRVKSVIPWLI